MAPPLPSVTEPEGVSVLPAPTCFVLKACPKSAVSPLAMPGLTVGTPAELVVPSYTLLSVTAVTVIGLAVISPVVLEAGVTA